MYPNKLKSLSFATGLIAIAAPIGIFALSNSVNQKQSSQEVISDDNAMFFEARIRPILVEKCQPCHGETKQLAGLRLDSYANVKLGGANGPVLIAGNPASSKLCNAVSYASSLKMPPGGKLPQNQIDDIMDWVKRGAPWPQTKPGKSDGTFVLKEEQRKFWSFQMPNDRIRVPQVRQSKLLHNPVDAFIESELERRGLTLSPIADKRSLIRRATYDLTGLPPTITEINNFLSDTSPSAFEKVVDRLLASSQYGERWGRHWLDLVRYCDSLDARSLGAEGDIGLAYKYRDWVVKSFNNDFPYDKFVQYQIAGDLLPPANPTSGNQKFNRDGTIATGVLTIGNWGNGDADKEKIYTDIVDDQVDLISRTFLGLTVGCARCHNHKFDPISTRDYYSLAGFFFSTHILDKFTPKGQGENIQRVALTSPEDERLRTEYNNKIATINAKISAETNKSKTMLIQDLNKQIPAYLKAVSELKTASFEEIDKYAASHDLAPYAIKQWREALGFGGYRRMNIAISNVLNNVGVSGFRGTGDTPSLVVNATAEPKSILTFVLPPKSVNVHPGPQSGVLIAWNSPVSGSARISGKVIDADPACGDGIAWAIVMKRKTGSQTIASGGFENGGSQDISSGKIEMNLGSIPVHQGDRIEFQVLPKSSHSCDTTTVQWQIEIADKKWDISKDLVPNIHQGNPHQDSFGNQSVWSFEDMNSSGPMMKLSPSASRLLEEWKQLQSTSNSTSSESVSRKFAEVYSEVGDTNPFWIRQPADNRYLPESSRSVLSALEQELEDTMKSAPPPIEFANAVRDGGIPETIYAGYHDVRIHQRGSYARLGDIAPRGFPAILNKSGTVPPLHGSGRAELAAWVGSDQNSLTARVWVNRIWQKHFGEGIVRTTSNFGFLGERPTNQPLLDYLAVSLVKGVNGSNPWSTKAIHKLIMLSASYQQQSHVSNIARKLDPDNRLFSRQNRQRLESEAIRDSLINAGGKLDLTAGGPAVRDFTSPRRSLYVITIRSDRTGFGPLFDVADSTGHADHRINSTVAPQALYMMNNPFVQDQAVNLAKRANAEGGSNPKAKIEYLYQSLYGRLPSQQELSIGVQYFGTSMDAPVGYCKLLLCANEFLYID